MRPHDVYMMNPVDDDVPPVMFRDILSEWTGLHEADVPYDPKGFVIKQAYTYDYDGRRSLSIYSCWIFERPFAIMLCSGREERDTRHFWVTDNDAFMDAVLHIRAQAEIYPQTTVDLFVDIAELRDVQ